MPGTMYGLVYIPSIHRNFSYYFFRAVRDLVCSITVSRLVTSSTPFNYVCRYTSSVLAPVIFV